MKVFPTLWASGDWQDGNFVVADKGYDVYQVVKLIRDTGRQPIIPRRRNALFEGVLPQFVAKYRFRFAIEHFFSKLKKNKRLVLRFDKLDLTFFSFFSIACLKIFKLLCSQCHIGFLPYLIQLSRSLATTDTHQKAHHAP